MSFDNCSDCDDCGPGYEFCSRRSSFPGVLPFDPLSIENLILSVVDKFDFRVMMTNERTRDAILVTAGFALAGGLIGKMCGGRMGAAVGGAVGGACGIGVVAISMREVWKEIRPKFADVFDLVYDYLAGLGIKDYASAAMFLANTNPQTTVLAKMILESSSHILGKQLVSNLGSLTSA
ncbi:uncharacterized protein LOC125232409 [Leguminivora glycinivorella]|uniref:uncharacterized protein LOC125232409 n=1 Tax=Leguminivora glycinivorella TaxID=1035111 RepID=UPI00200CBA98|nr:uncharacterized protein LOC125232409 [Leguminivora glycinivorella]